MSTQKSQFGRSLVEMILVIALIGLLTIGGIAGYNVLATRTESRTVAETIARHVIQRRHELMTAKGRAENLKEDIKGPHGVLFDIFNDMEKHLIVVKTKGKNSDLIQALSKSDVLKSEAYSIDTPVITDEESSVVMKFGQYQGGGQDPNHPICTVNLKNKHFCDGHTERCCSDNGNDCSSETNCDTMCSQPVVSKTYCDGESSECCPDSGNCSNETHCCASGWQYKHLCDGSSQECCADNGTNCSDETVCSCSSAVVTKHFCDGGAASCCPDNGNDCADETGCDTKCSQPIVSKTYCDGTTSDCCPDNGNCGNETNCTCEAGWKYKHLCDGSSQKCCADNGNNCSDETVCSCSSAVVTKHFCDGGAASCCPDNGNDCADETGCDTKCSQPIVSKTYCDGTTSDCCPDNGNCSNETNCTCEAGWKYKHLCDGSSQKCCADNGNNCADETVCSCSSAVVTKHFCDGGSASCCPDNGNNCSDETNCDTTCPSGMLISKKYCDGTFGECCLTEGSDCISCSDSTCSVAMFTKHLCMGVAAQCCPDNGADCKDETNCKCSTSVVKKTYCDGVTSECCPDNGNDCSNETNCDKKCNSLMVDKHLCNGKIVQCCPDKEDCKDETNCICHVQTVQKLFCDGTVQRCCPDNGNDCSNEPCDDSCATQPCQTDADCYSDTLHGLDYDTRPHQNDYKCMNKGSGKRCYPLVCNLLSGDAATCCLYQYMSYRTKNNPSKFFGCEVPSGMSFFSPYVRIDDSACVEWSAHSSGGPGPATGRHCFPDDYVSELQFNGYLCYYTYRATMCVCETCTEGKSCDDPDACPGEYFD